MEDAKIKYGDIIDHEHHTSPRHPRMSRLNRAAQFSPFAALTGYDELITEAARETQSRISLDEDRKSELNEKLVYLLGRGRELCADFRVFVPDSRKDGGEYAVIRGRIAGYNEIGRSIHLEGGTIVFIDDIAGIDIVEEDY